MDKALPPSIFNNPGFKPGVIDNQTIADFSPKLIILLLFNQKIHFQFKLVINSFVTQVIEE